MNAPLRAGMPAGALVVARAPLNHFAVSLTNRVHTQDHIRDLAKSLDPHGVIQPITARPWPASRGPAPDGVIYEIVIGEGRWLASREVDLLDIPFFWRELTDKQALEMQLIENLKRKDLTAIEEAEGYRRLMKDHGHTAESIGEGISKSKGYVYARLKLLDLGGPAREAFQAGKLDASTALLVARITSSTLQKKAVAELTKGHDGEAMSYRAAKNHIRYNFTVSLKQATFSTDDAALVPAAGSCMTCPKRSGNAPDICADIDDADVCTDTQCFDNKRLVRRNQLIANAEARNIPVLGAKASHDYRCNGEAIDLDDVVDGDGQERTYRQILGDDAPVSALIEVGNSERSKQLVEVAEPTALKKALVKAGWTPDLLKHAETTEAERKQRAKSEAAAALRDKNRQAGEVEHVWRAKLVDSLLPNIATVTDISILDANKIIPLLATAWLRQDFVYVGELDDVRLARLGIVLPEGSDPDDEIENVCAAIATWPVGKALALLFDAFTGDERAVNYHGDAQTIPHTLLALADWMGLDAQLLRKESPIAEPDQAAATSQFPQANEHGIYPDDGCEVIAWRKKKNWAHIQVLQVADGWVWNTEHHFGNGGQSSGLSRKSLVTTRDLAVAYGAMDIYSSAVTDTELSPNDQATLKAWAKAIHENGTPAPGDETAATPPAAAQAHGISGEEKTEAAPAGGKTVKANAKTKSTPAPALPANEPATPVKPAAPLNPVQAWPFPTGARKVP